MADTLVAQKRETRGSRHSRRLRAAGSIPAILYGHGSGNDQFKPSMVRILLRRFRHGTRLVELSGDVSENALIREIQWDTFGTEILHVDFTRVSADERIEVLVAVELRGEAPGTKVGGVVETSASHARIGMPCGSDSGKAAGQY